MTAINVPFNTPEILVAGNGYDLANGLRTRYSDFMKQVLSDYIFNYVYHNKVQDKIKNAEEYKEITELFLNKPLKGIALQNIFEDFDDSDSFISDFFSNQLILILLHKYCPAISILRTYLEVDPLHNIYLDVTGEKKLTPFRIQSICLDLIRNLSESKAIDIDLKWVDVEAVLLEIISRNVKSELGKIISPDKEAQFYGLFVSEELSNKILFSKSEFKNINLVECKRGLDMFKRVFSNYLKRESKKYNKTEEHPNFGLEKQFDHVISLNYTNICSNSLKPNSYKNVCYIHGCLDNNNIVIGAAEKKLLEERDAIPFYKYSQRTIYKTDEDFRSWLDKPYTLTFYGCSLGLSDYDVVRDLLLIKGRLNPSLKRLSIYCYGDEARDDCGNNLAYFLGKDIFEELRNKIEFIPIVNT